MGILDAAREVERRLEPLAASAALAPAREDVERQLRRLVRPGFVTATGVKRLADVERYLRAAARRLERLPNAPAPDLDRMRAVHELEAAHERRLQSWPPRPPGAGGAARGAVEAGGAARQPLRAGARHARPGVQQADPALIEDA